MAYNLFRLNKWIGMKNPVPYRNRQSTMLPRKSISFRNSYPKPFELARLLKTPAGIEQLKKKIQTYQKKRRNAANRDFGKEGHFKPRTHLMKKKRRA